MNTDECGPDTVRHREREQESTREREQESTRERERRRLAEIFGDVLPESTTDDRDDGQDARGGPDGRGPDARDAELLRDVPPHHG